MDETLKNMVELNLGGVEMDYSIVQEPDGRLCRTLAINGRVRDHREVAIVVAQADAIVTGEPVTPDAT